MRALFVATAMALVLVAPTARANGRFPATNQLVVAPTDARTLVLRTTFGVLVSRDGGANWDWVCERAVGYGGQTEDPSIGVTAIGAIVAGTFEGLAVSPDTGCGWAFVGGDLASKVVVDVVVRPDAPHAALALTNKYTHANDAGDPVYASRIYASSDDGATWAPFGAPLDPTAVLETMEVAATDPHRVYVSGFSGSGATLKASLYVSTDDGATWTARPIPLDPATEHAPYIAAVDPKNADRVYVRTSGDSTSRLLVTSDAGASFTAAFGGAQLAGFALSTDGSKVYVGGPKDGLNVASATDLQFKKTSSIAVQCLRTSGATLYACSNEVSGFILGASQDDGASFAPLLHLATIRGPIACPASSTAAACVADWPKLKDSLGIPSPPDAGADAGPTAAAPSKGCGCAALPASTGGASALAVLALAALAARRGSRR